MRSFKFLDGGSLRACTRVMMINLLFPTYICSAWTWTTYVRMYVPRCSSIPLTYLPPAMSLSRWLGCDRKVFRVACWIFLPAQLALLAYACHAVNTVPLTPLEFFGETIGWATCHQIPIVQMLVQQEAHEVTCVLCPPRRPRLAAAFYWVASRFHRLAAATPGFVVSVAVYTGGIGITLSHELVHKPNRLEQWLGERDGRLDWKGRRLGCSFLCDP